MLFNSSAYLLYFPVVTLLYFAIPKKWNGVRNLWLLGASYFFYMNWNAAYALLLFGSTLVTYLAGLGLSVLQKKEKPTGAKCVLALSFIINIGLLFFYKYANFFIENVNRVLRIAHQSTQFGALDILLPVGISFYIFQALGYTMDVYRGKMQATKNLFRYMLFVSFFPQLVAGPIERSGHLMKQFDEAHEFDVDRIREGLLTMLWGLFMKIMIADNIGVYVSAVMAGYTEYTGVEIALAALLFTIQIYCDFGGYSHIAIGSAKVLGFELMENFHAPYYATSVKDFWKRWHISLTGWFHEYLYISMGGNRKGKVRTYIHTFVVFFVSGMWHGAAWTYIGWGVLNGIYMIVEQLTQSFRDKLKPRLGIDESRFSFTLFCRIWVYLLFTLSLLVFNSPSLGDFGQIVKHALLNFKFPVVFGLAILRTGFSAQLIIALILAIFLLFIVDGKINRGENVAQFVFKQGIWFRWAVYLGLLFMILVFGAYGAEYAQTEFIYFQF